jgi:hypothetical protein
VDSGATSYRKVLQGKIVFHVFNVIYINVMFNIICINVMFVVLADTVVVIGFDGV